MKRTTIITLCLALATGTASAQTATTTDKNLFNHMDLGVTLGSTGFGLDITMPAGEYVKLRTGFTYMPHFTKNMHFGVQVGNETDPAEQARRFNNLADFLEGFTGYRAQSSICMEGKPKFNNFKLLVDVFPFKENKHWHFTAGFYAGRTKIADAINTQADMPSLMAMNIYNSLYWNVYNEQDVISYNGTGGELPPSLSARILKYGEMGMRIGEFKHDFYATQDIYYTHDVYDKDQFEVDEEGNFINYKLIHKKGDIQYRKGELMYHAGDTYRMMPDQNMMVKARALVNAFRPYLGVGYNSVITKDKRTTLAVDCGIMMWGGSPKIITHDGVDMLHDLTNVNGQVGDILRVINRFPIYPVLELRITRKLF